MRRSGQRRSKARSSPLAVATTSYVPLLFSLVTAPLTARALGVSGKGLVALVVVINDVGNAVFRWGLPEATAFYLKRGFGFKPIRRAVRRFGFLALPFAACLGVAVVAPNVARSQGLVFCVVAFVMTAWSPIVNTTAGCLRNALMAAGDLASLRDAPVIGALPFILVIPIAHWLGVLTVNVVLGVYAGSALLQRIYFGAKARHRFTQDENDTAVSLAAMLRFGTKTVPAALSELGNSRLDQMILVPLVGLAPLGLYSVAVTVGMLPVAFGLGLATATFRLMPTTVESAGSHEPGTAIRLAVPPLLVISLMLGGSVPYVVPFVFGEAFQGAVVPCLLLLPGAFAMAINYSVWQTANALGRPEISSITQLISLAVTVILLVLLLPSYGIRGAAVATSVAYVVRLVTSLQLVRRLGVRNVVPHLDDLKGSVRMLFGRT